MVPGHVCPETARLVGAVAAEVTRELIDHPVVHPKPGWRAGIEVEIVGRLNALQGEKAYPNGVAAGCAGWW
jgi:hypothetical protein